MRQIISLLRLIRLQNSLLAGVGVWLGGYLAGGSPFSDDLRLASVAVALTCAAGNALNDFADFEIDKINHPERPLARQEIPLYMALLVALVFYFFGLIVSLLVNIYVFVMLVGGGLLLLFYNFGLKRIAVWGNLVVAVLGGLTFIAGGLAVSREGCWNIPGPLVPAAFATMLHLGREWIKDMADVRGDRRAGYRTLPMLISTNRFLSVTTILFSGLIFLTLVPVYYQWYGPAYTIIAIGLIDLSLVIIVFYLTFSRHEGRFEFVGKILKLLMIFGLLAFLLGKN